MKVITVEHHVGRLLEFRLLGQDISDDEHRQVMADWRISVVEAHRATGKIVVVADMRDVSVMAPNVAAATKAFMQGDNVYLERSAILGRRPGIFTMQIERLRREAANPNRRHFEEPRDAVAWLSEVLDPAEIARLKHFVATRPPTKITSE